jgi:hypothetical protein
MGVTPISPLGEPLCPLRLPSSGLEPENRGQKKHGAPGVASGASGEARYGGQCASSKVYLSE